MIWPSITSRYNNAFVDKVIAVSNLYRGYFQTPIQMQAWGYSEERIQWTLKNQEITHILNKQGLSEYEIAEHMAIMNPASQEDLQRMGFTSGQISRLYPPKDS
jgi:hypothetical protein